MVLFSDGGVSKFNNLDTVLYPLLILPDALIAQALTPYSGVANADCLAPPLSTSPNHFVAISSQLILKRN